MRKKGMEVSAKLKNIVILDCNKEAFYKKVPTASAYECLPLYLKKKNTKEMVIVSRIDVSGLHLLCFCFVSLADHVAQANLNNNFFCATLFFLGCVHSR